jgi:molybdate transport system substrate-binding protein
MESVAPAAERKCLASGLRNQIVHCGDYGTRPRSIATKAALLSVVLLLHVTAAYADDVVVMTSGAFAAAYLELAKDSERTSKNKVVTAATSMVTGADSIPSRLARGESVDVVIVAADALDALIEDGMVLAGSRVDLARSSIGMAVRASARKPDITSVERLKQALLEAKSVAYSASVSGDYLVGELFPRLGIAAQLE